jgi:hypothetical protein
MFAINTPRIGAVALIVQTVLPLTGDFHGRGAGRVQRFEYRAHRGAVRDTS